MSSILSKGATSTHLRHSKTEELQAQRDALIMAYPLQDTKTSSNLVTASATSSKISQLGTDDVGSESEPRHAGDSEQNPTKPSPEHTALVMEDAKRVVKEHIKLLHSYNEIRDIGQGLLGMIADQRGVRLVDVMEEFGVGSND